LKNFDKGLGGMMIDDGEDYFLADNSTPEGAIVKIEEAYNEGNLEKIIACKDFYTEAKFLLDKTGHSGATNELVEKTAEVIKLSFIKSIQENGMPKFNQVKQAFPKREKISDEHMIITEVCYYSDGGKSIQRLNLCKAVDGWKVLHPANE